MTLLELLADAAVVASCLAAAIGCFVLNRRVRTLSSTEAGVGKAVKEMSRSVHQFEKLLVAAEASAREATTILDEQLVHARRLVAQLETLGGAAPRAGVAKTAVGASDPLADVAPKGASVATTAARPAPGKAVADGAAQRRLAELARQYGAAADVAAGARA